MKEKREKYEKPQSVAIEMEQPLMNTASIGINPKPENRPGSMGAPRYEGEDDWDE